MGKLPPLRMFMVATVVCLGGSFHFGYQLFLPNPAQDAFMSFINDSNYAHYGWGLSRSQSSTTWSVIVATLLMGAIFGSLTIGFISSRFGRKRGLYISIGLTSFATLLAVISYHAFSFELFIASRILLGFAISLSLGLVAMFLSESSPKECRGSISTMIAIFSNAGCFYGAMMGMPVILGTKQLWWYLFLNELIILLLVLVALPFIPESPEYSLLRGSEAEARLAVKFFYGCGPAEVASPLNRIRKSLNMRQKTMSLMEVFKDRHSRKGTIVGMTVSIAGVFSGCSVLDSFAVGILKKTGLSAQNASFGNLGLVAVLLVSSVLSSMVIDRLGRRLLALISNGGIVIVNMFIFIFMYCYEECQAAWPGYCLIVAIAFFEFFFSIGLGPLNYFLGSELVSQSARGVSQTCATMANVVGRGIIAAIFLPMAEAIGQAFTYLILSIVPMILTFIYLYFNMPETKNRSYKEITNAMEDLPSAPRFFSTKKKPKSSPNFVEIDLDS